MWSTAIDLLPGGRVVGVSFTVLRHLRSPSGILHSWWVWLMAEFCRMGNAGLMAGYLIRCQGGCLSLVSVIPRARLNLSWCSVWLIEGFARLFIFSVSSVEGFDSSRSLLASPEFHVCDFSSAFVAEIRSFFVWNFAISLLGARWV